MVSERTGKEAPFAFDSWEGLPLEKHSRAIWKRAGLPFPSAGADKARTPSTAWVAILRMHNRDDRSPEGFAAHVLDRLATVRGYQAHAVRVIGTLRSETAIDRATVLFDQAIWAAFDLGQLVRDAVAKEALEPDALFGREFKDRKRSTDAFGRLLRKALAAKPGATSSDLLMWMQHQTTTLISEVERTDDETKVTAIWWRPKPKSEARKMTFKAFQNRVSEARK